ncbi:MAG: FeoA family protein [Caldisericia bacterium]|nr:FeoA family protein [Caldisericia bacterium]MDD4614494.1 FeoA family protein [Caldisericia bacterium]
MRFFRHRGRNCHGHPSCSVHNPSTCRKGSSIYEFPRGKQVQIVAIRGHHCGRCHLIPMGFIPGTLLTILENDPNKTCLVSIENRKITLDHQTALSLVVQPA